MPFNCFPRQNLCLSACSSTWQLTAVLTSARSKAQIGSGPCLLNFGSRKTIRVPGQHAGLIPIAEHTLQELEAIMVVNNYCNCHLMMVIRYLKMVFEIQLAGFQGINRKLR